MRRVREPFRVNNTVGLSHFLERFVFTGMRSVENSFGFTILESYRDVAGPTDLPYGDCVEQARERFYGQRPYPAPLEWRPQR